MINKLINNMLVAMMTLPMLTPGSCWADEKSAATIAEKIEKGAVSKRLAGIGEATAYAKRQEVPTEKLVEALIVALSDENADIQSAAARALAVFGPSAEKAVPALIAHMKGISESSGGDLLWIECSNALVSIGPDAVPFLLEAIDHGDANTFQGICASLAELGPSVAPMSADSIVESMTGLIETEMGERRFLATHVLVKLGPKAKAAVPALVEELDDEDFQNQLIACQALTAIGPDAKAAVRKLLWMIEEGNVSVRGHAALCLGAIGPVEGHDVLQAIVKRLDDPNQVVRERAMIGLGLMGTDAAAALPQIEKAMDGGGFHAKPEAALAHWRICGKSEKAVQLLVKLLDDPTHELLSMQKLGQIGSAANAAVPALLKKLQADDVSVKIEACNALANIEWDSAEVRKAFNALTVHDDAELAAWARAAIERLDKQAERR